MKKWRTIEDGAEWLMEEVNNPKPFLREISIWEARAILSFFFESYGIQVYSLRAGFSVQEAVNYTNIQITESLSPSFYPGPELRARSLTVLENGFLNYNIPFSRCRRNLKRLYAAKKRDMFGV